MQLNVIQTVSEFDALASEWNDLLNRSASHVPFLRHEYLHTWLQTLGGGEWDQGDLFIITARTSSGELIGIAPFFLTSYPNGEQVLMLLGSHEISDYLDLIVPQEYLESFITLVFDFLTGDHAPGWEIIDLYNLLEDSESLPILQAAAEKMGWKTRLETLQPAPHIALPDDWETYLASIKKKQRHEIRRKLRRAANHELPVSWYFVENSESLDTEIDSLLALMAYDPEKEAFLTDVMKSQMRNAVHKAFNQGWLQLSFLEVGGEKAAAYLNFDFDNKLWIYNSGLNHKFYSLSPGWVLLAHLIQWAIAQGREELDFMRGDEAYKYRFGGVDRFVKRLTIHR